MDGKERTYTYRGGEKLALVKEPGRFVVRALPDELQRAGLPTGEVVSSSSTRISCDPDNREPLMARARGLAPTHHAYSVAESGAEYLPTDRVLVRTAHEMTAEEIAVFAGEYGLLLRERYGPRDFLFQLTDATGMNPVKLVVKLTEEDARVAFAENDVNVRAAVRQVALPADPHYQQQWHLHTRRAHPEIDPRSSARCEEAWQILGGLGDGAVVVAVTDDGCLLDHPDFDSLGKFAGWGYFRGSRLIVESDIDADPARMYESGANHGTACCGVVAGEADGVLTVGAAPGCRLLPIKWESEGSFLKISDSKLLTALNHIADACDVMSNSWGGVPVSLWSRMVVERIETLARSGGRRGKGIVFLWAAGNENCPISHSGHQDIPYTDGIEVVNGTPFWVGVKTSKVFINNLADLPGVVHVAALASTARRSHYSNYGPGIDLCAPSSNAHTYHRMIVDGLGITTTTGDPSQVRHTFGGTSSATPLVAGIAALVISADSSLGAEEVISVLRRTASRDLDFGTYPRTPPASFDPDTSWDISPVAPYDDGAFVDVGHPDGPRSPWYGFGKVDAAAAVATVLGERPAAGGEVRAETAPGLAIPDDEAAGIASPLTITGHGRIADIAVEVDITHTWIGDLAIRLGGPDGMMVPLHTRNGGGAANLRTVFDRVSTPALAAFVDREMAGTWTLFVADRAPADSGTLDAWVLSLTPRAVPVIAEDVGPATIPDAQPAGIERTVTVPGTPVIGALAVSVDITHPWIGDLVVSVTPPGGAAVVLHDRRGGSDDNIVRTWQAADHPGLRALLGANGGGTWTLHVADLAGADVGKLNRWSVQIGP